MVQPLTIGNLNLSTNLLLAPIAGYTDLSFRVLARSCGGVGLACTDLLSPHAILRHTPKTMRLVATCPQDSPLCIQLYGGDAKMLSEAARWAEDRGAHAIDINMGCPVDKITKQDGGSKLLCDPDRTLRMVQQIRAVLRNVPLTCKLRLGWDDQHIVAPYLAARLEQLGVAAITIHGRTTAMLFSGRCRLEGIADVVAAVKRIPVIGNGDVHTPQDAKAMIDRTGCAGVMIGRAALSAPWIFRDVWSYLTTGTIPPEPTLREKCDLMRRHFYDMVRVRSERSAIIEFRKRVSWYAKQMHPSRRLRQDMRFINTPADFEKVIENFLAWREKSPSLHPGHDFAYSSPPETPTGANDR